MDRKQFLGTLLVLPVGVFLVNCSSSDSGSSGGGDTTTPAAPPTQNAGMDIYTSSTDEAHFHTFSFDDADLTTPPAAGVSGATSNNEDHTHMVSISMDQLTQVGMSMSVQVATSFDSGHSHLFTFTKIGA
jgi:hypothetical protein